MPLERLTVLSSHDQTEGWGRQQFLSARDKTKQKTYMSASVSFPLGDQQVHLFIGEVREYPGESEVKGMSLCDMELEAGYINIEGQTSVLGTHLRATEHQLSYKNEDKHT